VRDSLYPLGNTSGTAVRRQGGPADGVGTLKNRKYLLSLLGIESRSLGRSPQVSHCRDLLLVSEKINEKPQSV
jgi:hypothetical protein